ncbi:MAG: DUF58 domain-containing protein [Verrucomicrobiales bacterium]
MPDLSDTPDLNGIAARARAYADLFSLPLEDRHWRGNPGDHSGAGLGSSLDFQDHRHYLPGDDPRRINWQAYARTGNYTLKLYREEVQPIVEIVFDVSDSMFADPRKADRALELFYFAWASGEKNGAATSAWIVKGSRWKALEPAAVFSHRWRSAVDELPSTGASASPNLATVRFRPRSLRILVSDLLFLASPEPFLRTLLQGTGRAAVLCPFSSSESDPAWSGNYEFVDSESGGRHNRRVDRSTLRLYLDAYRRHFDGWKVAALRSQTPLARVPALGSFEAALKLEAISAGAVNLA